MCASPIIKQIFVSEEVVFFSSMTYEQISSLGAYLIPNINIQSINKYLIYYSLFVLVLIIFKVF